MKSVHAKTFLHIFCCFSNKLKIHAHSVCTASWGLVNSSLVAVWLPVENLNRKAQANSKFFAAVMILDAKRHGDSICS